jgi:hypothetical protein
MITYFIWGLIFTFIFDVILKNTKNKLSVWERLGFVTLWPVFLLWFIYFILRETKIRN